MALLLELSTVQAGVIKTVVDALKELVIDCNLEFNETGLKVCALDASHVVLVHLKLDADKFEKYHCARKLYVGVNMMRLHLLIRTLGAKDILTLFVERDDPNHLGIRIVSPEKSSQTTFKLAMLDINVTNISIPPAQFPTQITMASADFQKLVRDMSALADLVEIRNVASTLRLSCVGDFCSQETTLSTDSSSLSIVKPDGADELEIIQGVFSLKHLTQFTRCTHLSPTVEIFLRNNFPLILRYAVASLGEIKLCLAQQDAATD